MANTNEDPKIKSVLLVTAMEQEALPCVAALSLEKVSPSPFPWGLPAVAWKGNVGKLHVHLIWCGRYAKLVETPEYKYPF